MIAACPSPHQFMVSNLNYNHEERANALYAVVKQMVTISGRGSAEEQLSNIEHWATNAQPQEYSRLGIRGFGLAAFQYLRMLFGANTTKPYIHIYRFVECCVGHQVSPIQALRLLERCSLLRWVILAGFGHYYLGDQHSQEFHSSFGSFKLRGRQYGSIHLRWLRQGVSSTSGAMKCNRCEKILYSSCRGNHYTCKDSPKGTPGCNGHMENVR
jgi:hypothetical protein